MSHKEPVEITKKKNFMSFFKKAPRKTPEEIAKAEAEANKKRRILEVKYSQARLREIWETFTIIESKIGGRTARKQFRRDFIADGKVMGNVIQAIIDQDQKIIDELEKELNEKEKAQAKIAAAAEKNKQ